MNKQDYNPRRVRFQLAEDLIFKVNEIQTALRKARDNELSFASNEEVSTKDLDEVWKMSSDLLQAIIKLGTDNFEPQ